MREESRDGGVGHERLAVFSYCIAARREQAQVVRGQLDLNETVAFVKKHFSSTPTASDAFAQAAISTASWAREVRAQRA